MRDDPGPGRFSAGYVELHLEKAGRALMALPYAGCFPAGIRTFWSPGYDSRRWDPPSSRAISDMDEAYRWCALIPDLDQRRLVLMRSLVWPDSPENDPRYEYSWRRLRRITGLHDTTLIARWSRGIGAIVRRLNQPRSAAAAPAPGGFASGPSSAAAAPQRVAVG
jgi:hypothetical protein